MARFYYALCLFMGLSWPVAASSVIYDTDAEVSSSIMTNSQFHIIYSLEIPGLVQGDVVECAGHFNSTNNTDKIIALGSRMIASQQSWATKGTLVGYSTVENFDKYVHHKTRYSIGYFSVPSPGTWYVNLLGYALLSSSKKETVSVDDVGRLYCKVEKGLRSSSSQGSYSNDGSASDNSPLDEQDQQYRL